MQYKCAYYQAFILSGMFIVCTLQLHTMCKIYKHKYIQVGLAAETVRAAVRASGAGAGADGWSSHVV